MNINDLINSDNIMFSKLKGNELIEILDLINSYYLEYRDVINLNKNNTFGLELEFEHSNNIKILNDLISNNLYTRWRISGDSTLYRGAEITSPILNDKVINWDELGRVCNIVNKYARVGSGTGSHIHYGSQILEDNPEYYRNFLYLYAVYENILFRFGYGENNCARRGINKYAHYMALTFLKEVFSINWNKTDQTIVDMISPLMGDRYVSVNFNNMNDDNHYSIDYIRENGFDPSKTIIMDTIEFRFCNGTLNPIIWQNNINCFGKLLERCTKELDYDLLHRRVSLNKEYFGNISFYKEIFLDQVLEFVDLVFDNNKDKIYFLRQYLKDYTVGFKTDKVKSFTR